MLLEGQKMRDTQRNGAEQEHRRQRESQHAATSQPDHGGNNSRFGCGGIITGALIGA